MQVSPAHNLTLTLAQREVARIAGISEFDYARALTQLRAWKKLYHGWAVRQRKTGRLCYFSRYKRECLASRKSKSKPEDFEVLPIEFSLEACRRGY